MPLFPAYSKCWVLQDICLIIIISNFQYFSDSDRCPVQSFIRYKKKLNPGCPFLFQRPRTTQNDSGYYFDKAPVGHNKLVLGNKIFCLFDRFCANVRLTKMAMIRNFYNQNEKCNGAPNVFNHISSCHCDIKLISCS